MGPHRSVVVCRWGRLTHEQQQPPAAGRELVWGGGGLPVASICSAVPIGCALGRTWPARCRPGPEHGGGAAPPKAERWEQGLEWGGPLVGGGPLHPSRSAGWDLEHLCSCDSTYRLCVRMPACPCALACGECPYAYACACAAERGWGFRGFNCAQSRWEARALILLRLSPWALLVQAAPGGNCRR